MATLRVRGSAPGFVCAIAAALLLFCGVAQASDGYFAHGYGMKAKGRGGAAIAFTTDAFGGANNPATIAWVGNRFEVGMTILQPIRGAKREGSAGGIADYSETSDHHYFEVPELAFSYQLNDRLGVGVAMYANGGLDTFYHNNMLPAAACGGTTGRRNALCGQGRLGVNLMQVIIAPTIAYKLTPKMSIGISPLLGVQSFKAEGLQAFQALSNAPNEVTNKGTDYGYGYGARIGYLYKPFSWLNVGAVYSTRVYMSPFNRYQGLFANGGKFDIPASYGVGVMVAPIPELHIGLDWERIQFGDVPSAGNPSTIPPLLGSHGGPGFHWRDVNAYKFGVEVWPKGTLTLRFGYNHQTQVINPDAVTFSILAPGVAQDHLTVGFTWHVTKASEVSGFYMRWINASLSGPSSLPFGGTETLRMFENALGFAYAYRF